MIEQEVDVMRLFDKNDRLVHMARPQEKKPAKPKAVPFFQRPEVAAICIECKRPNCIGDCAYFHREARRIKKELIAKGEI